MEVYVALKAPESDLSCGLGTRSTGNEIARSHNDVGVQPSTQNGLDQGNIFRVCISRYAHLVADTLITIVWQSETFWEETNVHQIFRKLLSQVLHLEESQAA